MPAAPDLDPRSPHSRPSGQATLPKGKNGTP
jgi:hypothetical protein